MAQLRLYQHFPTLEDSQALLGLLRMNAILFETRFRKQTDYHKLRTEATQLEVWVRAIDYEMVQQLEAALTVEQAAELAHNYFFIIAADEELEEIAAQKEFPEEAAIAQSILLNRKPYEPAPPEPPAPIKPVRVKSAVVTLSPIRSFLWKYGVLILLLALFLLLDPAGRLVLHASSVTERKVRGQFLTYETVVRQLICERGQ